MALKVTLVARVVVANTADEVLDASVDGEVPPEERLAAEHVTAHRAHVPVPVHLPRVCPKVSLAEETLTAALQLHRRGLVHRVDVALQVVLAVRVVAAVLAQYHPHALLPAEGPRPWHRRLCRHVTAAAAPSSEECTDATLRASDYCWA